MCKSAAHWVRDLLLLLLLIMSKSFHAMLQGPPVQPCEVCEPVCSLECGGCEAKLHLLPQGLAEQAALHHVGFAQPPAPAVHVQHEVYSSHITTGIDVPIVLLSHNAATTITVVVAAIAACCVDVQHAPL